MRERQAGVVVVVLAQRRAAAGLLTGGVVLRILPWYDSPVLTPEDIATTDFSATMTGEFFVVSGIIAVVEAQFFSGLDVPAGDNPDRLRRVFYDTIWITGMVDITCRISQRCPVNIVLVIQVKNVRIVVG